MAESPSVASQTASEPAAAGQNLAPQEKFRADYRPYPFAIDSLELLFVLGEEFTRVQATMRIKRQPGSSGQQALVFDGEDLLTDSIAIDGQALPASQYTIEGDTLTIAQVPDQFELTTEVRIKPQENTQLSGLYQSSGNFCTQCEAEGFRRITWFADRPDVMTRYLVRIEADRAKYPVLLSNGNRVEAGQLEGGQHYAVWQDPFVKPSYLFALVVGDLGHLKDKFTTCSGREVDLFVYSEPHNVGQLRHAMDSLKKAMKWDESVFGLEYDLDIYNIVAVEDFNMGAMENKSLNVFNTAYVLAQPESATDGDYEGIESVIAHEYFHNWTGNRVTCRDWFQLTLKEGLTVYRDQEFSADMGSRAVRRIETVRMLRAGQFAEDGGPMAHPIRPESYIAMDNFYTATVYVKGAEVIRMIQMLVGRQGFRKGMDLYFERHDGAAVTCDDFRAAMADANGINLDQFERWYSQAGTPVIEASGVYDSSNQRYTLKLRQSCPDTPGQTAKQPFHIPVAIGLMSQWGVDMVGTPVLELRQIEQEFTFEGIQEEPVPSLLRYFSAPVKMRMQRSLEQLAFLFGNDTDAFNRWEAGQQLATRVILGQIDSVREGAEVELPEVMIRAFKSTLQDQNLDCALRAIALVLPLETTLAEEMDLIDPQILHRVRKGLRRQLGLSLATEWRATYQSLASTEPYTLDCEAVGKRQLRNLCLAYLAASGQADGLNLCRQQFAAADNMTDSMGALSCLVGHSIEAGREPLAQFEKRWADDPLVMDKWFALQANADHDQVLEVVQSLIKHPAFSLKNPNKVRSLLRSFATNPVGFHRPDGKCYQFLADQLIALDSINPQVASRLVTALGRWRRYAQPWSNAMQAQLKRILEQGNLSKDVYEMVSKSLSS
jgi:aminopeptidase N